MAEQISVADIRAKFPMYSDLSDDQLISGIRQKFYPDIPIQDFVKRIKYTAPDPTGSGVENFFAGAGKAMTDLARGAGQWVPGLVSRADVAESRRLDAPLMSKGEGLAGNLVGNVAALLPTALIPGANTMAGAAMIGAGTGALQPSVSGTETMKDIALGGVLGPAALGVGRAVGAGYNALTSLFQPFTKSGQEKIAAATLQNFATNPQQAAQALRTAQPLVPGSSPTMAQASGDAGLAQLERTLVNTPETAGLLTGQYAANRAARLKAIQDVAGTDAHYNAIKQGRTLFAGEDYGNAMRAGIDQKMAEALQPQIASLMERPSIQAAKAEAVSLAKESGLAVNDFGSIEGLDWLKKGLDNLISKSAQPGSAVGSAKLKAMLQTKQDLMGVIETVAPAYKAANDNFAAMSKQVNSMDVARDLLNRMESPLARAGANGREMRDAYARALEAATESVKKQTGMNVALADVMNAGDVATLQNVAKDMGRTAASEDLGRAVGSNTAQNLAAQNLLRRTLGPTGMPQSWAESTALQSLLAPYSGLTKLAGSDRAVMQSLAEAAADPARAASLLQLTQQPGRLGLLGDSALPYLPTLPLGLLGYGSK